MGFMKTEKSQFDELIEFIKKLPINILSAIIILLCQRIHTPIKQFFCHHEIITEDGYYRILGRIDDVINVSGHRLGTKEIESAALVADEVAEAAVVPVNHEIKGKEPDLYIALKPGIEPTEELAKKISDVVCEQIGKIAKPRKVWLVPDMPKTRSGKIMRRVLGAILNKKDVGDVMTLANPEVVEIIKEMVDKS